MQVTRHPVKMNGIEKCLKDLCHVGVLSRFAPELQWKIGARRSKFWPAVLVALL